MGVDEVVADRLATLKSFQIAQEFRDEGVEILFALLEPTRGDVDDTGVGTKFNDLANLDWRGSRRRGLPARRLNQARGLQSKAPPGFTL